MRRVRSVIGKASAIVVDPTTADENGDFIVKVTDLLTAMAMCWTYLTSCARTPVRVMQAITSPTTDAAFRHAATRAPTLFDMTPPYSNGLAGGQLHFTNQLVAPLKLPGFHPPDACFSASKTGRSYS